MANSSLIYVSIWLVSVCLDISSAGKVLLTADADKQTHTEIVTLSGGSDTITYQVIPGGVDGGCSCECEYICSCGSGADYIGDCCSGTVPNKTIPGQYSVPSSGCNGWPSSGNCCCIPPPEWITDTLPPFFQQPGAISTRTYDANKDEQKNKPNEMKENDAEIEIEKKYNAELEKKQEGEPTSFPGKENTEINLNHLKISNTVQELDNGKQLSETLFPTEGPILCQ